MTFYCPRCGAAALAIAAVLELPADARSDEIQGQLLNCGGCGLLATGVYEESRRGAADAVDHMGWTAERENWELVEAEWGRCPSPRRAFCGCVVHRVWGELNPGGRNVAIGRLQRGKPFPLRLPGEIRRPPLPPAG